MDAQCLSMIEALMERFDEDASQATINRLGIRMGFSDEVSFLCSQKATLMTIRKILSERRSHLGLDQKGGI